MSGRNQLAAVSSKICQCLRPSWKYYSAFSAEVPSTVHLEFVLYPVVAADVHRLGVWAFFVAAHVGAKILEYMVPMLSSLVCDQGTISVPEMISLEFNLLP